MRAIRVAAFLVAAVAFGGCATSEGEGSAEHADEVRKLTNKGSFPYRGFPYDGDNPFED